MKQLFLGIALLLSFQAFSQSTATSTDKKNKSKSVLEYSMLKNRPNDHLMIQFGYDNWANTSDSIKITGFGRHFNGYAMYDMPFKTSPRFSVAIGAGLGSSNIYFDKQIVRIAPTSATSRVRFENVADTNQYKKFKLTNIWLEAPIELRFVDKPLQSGKSFKVAVGAKLGTLISAYTRGKNFQSASGQTIYGERYVIKERQKAYFNGFRLAATMRVGWGPFTAYGAYQVTSLFKEINGPLVRPYSIGLSLSGL